MKIIKIPVLLTVVSILSACSAAPNVTAEKATLFQAAGNLGSGEFDRQLKRKNLDLGNSRTEQKNAQRNQQLLQANLTQSRNELAQIKIALTAVENENARLAKKISQLKTSTAQQKSKKSRALAKISRLNKNTKKLRTTVKQQKTIQYKSISQKSKFNPYKSQLASLQQEVNVLREMLVND